MNVFKKTDHNQPLIDYSQVSILYTGGWSKNLNPIVSLVCFSIKGCKIIMASKHFKQTESKVKQHKLYEILDIVLNCDLSQMEHGTAKDVPALNMPVFHKWADNMHTSFEANRNKAVLVNCYNGRSRTGTVVALYLMKYHHLPANDAMSIVNSILGLRGITKDSINVHTINLHGNYGDWLRRWEKENNGRLCESSVDVPNTFFNKRKPDTSEEISTPNGDNSLEILKKRKLDLPEVQLILESHADYPLQYIRK